MIEVHELTRKYRTRFMETAALKRVSLKVEQGERIAVFGSSGSGKSTLLNVLGLLDRADEGTYRFNGGDVTSLSEAHRVKVRREHIGFIFQGFNLIDRLSARENVELALRYRGVARHQRREIALAALDRVGLSARSDHLPSQLSGGQQQRVAIARAVASRPLVLFADEPTGNLDTATGAQILDMLDSLNEDGMTVVLVSHDPAVSERAGRVIRMSDGEIVADDLSEVARRPSAAIVTSIVRKEAV
ncbi:MAG: ABC transporter ATP-binding protein [Pseudomonadota bacterium]